MRAHRLKLCMPNFPKRLPGIQENSGNCNMLLVTFNPRPSLRSKNYKNQEETLLTKSTKNPKKLLIFDTNADSMINKRNKIQSLVSTNNPDVILYYRNFAKKRFIEN